MNRSAAASAYILWYAKAPEASVSLCAIMEALGGRSIFVSRDEVLAEVETILEQCLEEEDPQVRRGIEEGLARAGHLDEVELAAGGGTIQADGERNGYLFMARSGDDVRLSCGDLWTGIDAIVSQGVGPDNG